MNWYQICEVLGRCLLPWRLTWRLLYRVERWEESWSNDSSLSSCPKSIGVSFCWLLGIVASCWLLCISYSSVSCSWEVCFLVDWGVLGGIGGLRKARWRVLWGGPWLDWGLGGLQLLLLARKNGFSQISLASKTPILSSDAILSSINVVEEYKQWNVCQSWILGFISGWIFYRAPSANKIALWPLSGTWLGQASIYLQTYYWCSVHRQCSRLVRTILLSRWGDTALVATSYCLKHWQFRSW